MRADKQIPMMLRLQHNICGINPCYIILYYTKTLHISLEVSTVKG